MRRRGLEDSDEEYSVLLIISVITVSIHGSRAFTARLLVSIIKMDASKAKSGFVSFHPTAELHYYSSSPPTEGCGPPPPDSGMGTILLAVSGMSCAQNCGRSVKEAILQVPGVLSAMVDFPSKVASVSIDPAVSVSLSALQAAVVSRGPSSCNKTLSVASLRVEFDIDVEGMLDRTRCIPAVFAALSSVPGVDSVVVDMPTAVAHVAGSILGPEPLERAIMRAGYRPRTRRVGVETTYDLSVEVISLK